MIPRGRILAGVVTGVALACMAFIPDAAADAIPASSTPLPSYITNGPVFAIARTASTIYLGGAFSEIGPVTGPAAAVSPATGAISPPIPQVSGGSAEVNAVLADGHGGWYLGGSFSQVGSTARQNLAHILPGGSVDPAFNPAPSKVVFALALAADGSKLYVGGAFRTIAGQPIRYLAALAASTGAAVSGFHATPNGTVVALAQSSDGSRLYVSGAFTSVGGQPLSHLAAVSAGTGAVAGGFAPNPDQGVFAIVPAADGSKVYVGGTFSTIGGQSVPFLAALDPSTGVPLGTFTPNAVAPVFALARSATALYAGGEDGLGPANSHLEAINLTTGAPIAGFTADTDSIVFSLALDGSTLYVGGDFTNVDGTARPHLAAVNASNGAVVGGFVPGADGGVESLSVSTDGTQLYAGGGFSSVGAKPAQNIAALHASDGTPVAGFSSTATTEIHALVLSADGTRLYAGGGPSSLLSGAPYLAALNAATGAAIGAFAPTIIDPVRALALSSDGTHVYAGFLEPAFASTNDHLRSFNTSDGTPQAGFAAGADDSVFTLALAPDGSRLYAGGSFANIGGQPIERLAALDPATGTAIAGFAPAPDGDVDSLLLEGGTLYVGGAFANIAGQAIAKLAAVSAANGAPVSGLNPAPNGSVFALTPDPTGTLLYAGGSFTSIGGQRLRHVAALTAVNGAAQTTFAPALNDTVNALAFSTDGTRLYAGGNFRLAGSQIQQGFAMFGPGLPAPPPPPPPPQPTLTGTGKARVRSVHRTLRVALGYALSCPAGGSSCTAKVKVTAMVRRRPRHHHKAKKAKITVASGTLTAAAGASTELVLKLSSAGIRALRSSRRLTVDERIVMQDGSGPVVMKTASAVLRSAAHHHKKRKKKK